MISSVAASPSAPTAPRLRRSLSARTVHPHLIALDVFLIGWCVAAWDMWYVDNRRHSLITAFGLLVIVLAPKRSIISMRVSLTIVPILSWIVLSRFWSWNVGYFNANFVKTIIDAPVLMVVAAVVPWERLVQRLLLWFYVAVAFTYAYSLLYEEARLMITPGEQTWSWHGSFPHKNTMLMFLVFGLAVVLGFETRRRARRIAEVAVAVLIVLSHSTTGLGVLVVVAAVVFWIKMLQAERTSRRAGFLLVTAVAGVGMLAAGMYSVPFVAEAAGKDTTFSGRTEIWAACWWAIGREPWLGYGWGGVFTGTNVSPTREMVQMIGFDAANAHNGVLDVLLNLGWVGLAAYLVFLAPLCARGWFLVKAHDPLGTTVMVFVATLLFISISEPVFLLAQFAVVAMLHPPVLSRVPRSAHARREAIAAATAR
ncbi:MAG: O-antigen ligase family protein [Ilumatobacteraceae bacterium]